MDGLRYGIARERYIYIYIEKNRARRTIKLACSCLPNTLICEMELSEILLQNGSVHIVVASYSGLYEEGDVERISTGFVTKCPKPACKPSYWTPWGPCQPCSSHTKPANLPLKRPLRRPLKLCGSWGTPIPTSRQSKESGSWATSTNISNLSSRNPSISPLLLPTCSEGLREVRQRAYGVRALHEKVEEDRRIVAQQFYLDDCCRTDSLAIV